MLHFAAARFGPLEKSQQPGAFAPGETEKRAGAGGRGFRTEESFHAPTDIGAAPGSQAIAFGRNPIKSKCVEQFGVVPCWRMIPVARLESNTAVRK